MACRPRRARRRSSRRCCAKRADAERVAGCLLDRAGRCRRSAAVQSGRSGRGGRSGRSMAAVSPTGTLAPPGDGGARGMPATAGSTSALAACRPSPTRRQRLVGSAALAGVAAAWLTRCRGASARRVAASWAASSARPAASPAARRRDFALGRRGRPRLRAEAAAARRHPPARCRAAGSARRHLSKLITGSIVASTSSASQHRLLCPSPSSLERRHLLLAQLVRHQVLVAAARLERAAGRRVHRRRECRLPARCAS